MRPGCSCGPAKRHVHAATVDRSRLAMHDVGQPGQVNRPAVTARPPPAGRRRAAAASSTRPGSTIPSPTYPRTGSSADPSSAASSTNMNGLHRNPGQDSWPRSGTSQVRAKHQFSGGERVLARHRTFTPKRSPMPGVPQGARRASRVARVAMRWAQAPTLEQ